MEDLRPHIATVLTGEHGILNPNTELMIEPVGHLLLLLGGQGRLLPDHMLRKGFIVFLHVVVEVE